MGMFSIDRAASVYAVKFNCLSCIIKSTFKKIENINIFIAKRMFKYVSFIRICWWKDWDFYFFINQTWSWKKKQLQNYHRNIVNRIRNIKAEISQNIAFCDVMMAYALHQR